MILVFNQKDWFMFFFNWYHVSVSIGIIIWYQNALIAYMQGKLNIFSIYIFMLSVSHIEEFDRSSLCLTRVGGASHLLFESTPRGG